MGGSAWEIEKDTMRSKGLMSGAVVGMDKNQRLGFEQGYAYARANPSPEKYDSNKAGRKENFIVELEVKSKLNQIQRNENNKKKKDELERLRLQ